MSRMGNMVGMAGIRRDIREGRREAELETHTYGVFRIGARGNVLKRPSDTFRTEEEAQKACANMIELNPGVSFIVQPL